MTRIPRYKRFALRQCFVFLFLFPALDLPAATLLVPSEYETIQEAVDSATEGDTIILSPGIYSEYVRLRELNVTIRSENPNDPEIVTSTIIGNGTNEDESCGIEFPRNEINGIVIMGLTFQRCVVGIRGNTSAASILGCHFLSNLFGIVSLDGMIRDSLFIDNTSAILGGNGEITNNTVLGKGKELLARSETISSYEGIIEGNVIAFGVAIAGPGIYNCSGFIANNTIFGNVATNAITSPRVRPIGGGITSCTGTIRNNILWGNTVDGEPVQIVDSSTPEYCCIQGWTGGGIGNIFTDPLFVDPFAHDFRLQSNSFCIDSGGTVTGSSVDLDGTLRGMSSTQETRGDGSNVDIGAYEFIGNVPPNSPPERPLHLSPVDGSVGVSIGPALESGGYTDPNLGDLHSASQWQVDDDGGFESPELDSDLVITHLTKFRAFGGTLAPSTEYYWRVRHMDNRYTWGDWSEPTRMTLEAFDALFVPLDYPTIQAAADGASEGDLVVVRGGLYQENVVFPGTNFHLRSVDPSDPEVVEGTIIHGVPVEGATYYSVLTFNGTETPDFVLEGLTITGGDAIDGGAIFGNDNSAFIKGNLFQKNGALVFGGALYRCNGVIEDNHFHNNTSSTGGAIYRCNGDIVRNTFLRNDARSVGGAGSQCNEGEFRFNLVCQNTSGEGGAFFRCDSDFFSNIINLNTATGAGNSFSSCNGLIMNNTLYENGRGIGSFFNCPSATILNNIILDPDGLVQSAEPRYCVVYFPSTVGGVGNFLANPRFVDSANGDFRLRGDSPCIDAGGLYSNVRNTDFDGNPRPVKGVNVERGDGTLADIGAFEFQIFENPRSDITSDTQVNHLDLFRFQSGWDQTFQSYPLDPRDVDEDMEIDGDDLLILLNDWGVTTGP